MPATNSVLKLKEFTVQFYSRLFKGAVSPFFSIILKNEKRIWIDESLNIRFSVVKNDGSIALKLFRNVSSSRMP